MMSLSFSVKSLHTLADFMCLIVYLKLLPPIWIYFSLYFYILITTFWWHLRTYILSTSTINLLTTTFLSLKYKSWAEAGRAWGQWYLILILCIIFYSFKRANRFCFIKYIHLKKSILGSDCISSRHLEIHFKYNCSESKQRIKLH